MSGGVKGIETLKDVIQERKCQLGSFTIYSISCKYTAVDK